MSNSLQEPRWRPLLDINPHEPSLPVFNWLTETGSLTERLKATDKDFSLHVLSESWCTAFPAEYEQLKIQAQPLVWIREIVLQSANIPCIYARTVIPATTYHENRNLFTTLGTTPIGNVLFTDPTMQRSEFEAARVEQGNYLFHLADSGVINKEYYWARRSVFYLRNQPLLISEVFAVS